METMKISNSQSRFWMLIFFYYKKKKLVWHNLTDKYTQFCQILLSRKSRLFKANVLFFIFFLLF